MKKSTKTRIYPSPQSGGFSSILLGSISVLLCFLILQKSSISVLSMDSQQLKYIPKETRIAWEVLPQLETQLTEQFVEANPNVPENPPDKSKQFSFRDQQAAQPEITKASLLQSAPVISGNEKSQKIIQGKKEKNVDQVANMIPTQAIKEKSDKRPSETIKNLISSKINIKKNSASEGSFTKENTNDGKNNKSSTITSSLRTPESLHSKQQTLQRPRPKLLPNLTHGPLMKSEMSAPRVGRIAIECRMHSYGVYVQEMLQSVEEQWNQLARGSIQYLQRDLLPGRITLRFELLSNGQISNLIRIDSEGESLPAELCRQAIASRVPFGQWNQDMINDFGDSDTVTISFLYQ